MGCQRGRTWAVVVESFVEGNPPKHQGVSFTTTGLKMVQIDADPKDRDACPPAFVSILLLFFLGLLTRLECDCKWAHYASPMYPLRLSYARALDFWLAEGCCKGKSHISHPYRFPDEYNTTCFRHEIANLKTTQKWTGNLRGSG